MRERVCDDGRREKDEVNRDVDDGDLDWDNEEEDELDDDIIIVVTVPTIDPGTWKREMKGTREKTEACLTKGTVSKIAKRERESKEKRKEEQISDTGMDMRNICIVVV